MEINKDVHRTFAEADIRQCLAAQVSSSSYDTCILLLI
jgi:hypothetical protein